MTETTLSLPTLHLNGTSKESLLEEIMDATSAISKAIDAVCKTAPNGRDYYPQGDGAFQKAAHEHCERLKKLHTIREELRVIGEYIALHH